jgi:hypothetical protein
MLARDARTGKHGVAAARATDDPASIGRCDLPVFGKYPKDCRTFVFRHFGAHRALGFGLVYVVNHVRAA